MQPDGNWTTRGYANSRIANSRTGHLADWSTRGLDNSRTSQLADWTSRELDNSRSRRCCQKGKLSTQSRRWHPRVVQSATCPVRELSSPRVDQSARCLVRESSSPRVGVCASCPVTVMPHPCRWEIDMTLTCYNILPSLRNVKWTLNEQHVEKLHRDAAAIFSNAWHSCHHY